MLNDTHPSSLVPCYIRYRAVSFSRCNVWVTVTLVILCLVLLAPGSVTRGALIVPTLGM